MLDFSCFFFLYRSISGWQMSALGLVSGGRTLNARKGRCPGAGVAELLSSAHKRQCRPGMMALGGGGGVGGLTEKQRSAWDCCHHSSRHPACLPRSKPFSSTLTFKLQLSHLIGNWLLTLRKPTGLELLSPPPQSRSLSSTNGHPCISFPQQKVEEMTFAWESGDFLCTLFKLLPPLFVLPKM